VYGLVRYPIQKTGGIFSKGHIQKVQCSACVPGLKILYRIGWYQDLPKYCDTVMSHHVGENVSTRTCVS